MNRPLPYIDPLKRKHYSPPETLHGFIDLLAADDFRGAACTKHSPYLWDGALQGEPHRSRKARHERAMQICAGCPIKQKCKQSQLHIPKQHRHGIWGGHNFT